ncbi:MAG: Bro-N domain-containing protein [Oscillospiraceae bacterium]|nr:Bro-N domain-containing protein [Oscillospiraceae bacterium]
MNDLIFFNYHGNDLRTVEINGELWWVLKDVCDVLELSNPTVTANRLDEDEVTKLDLGGQIGITNIINESGLYSVILRSDKPQAKPFRRWITHDVIPQIRKTGCYRLPKDSAAEKLWYGESVICCTDVGELLGMTNKNARDYIARHFREGLDWFTLKGSSLKRFKIENHMEHSNISSVTLIRPEVFYSMNIPRLNS